MVTLSLLQAEDVPQELREPGILTGYRPCPSSLRTCLLSLFTWSNETVNFWSHFLPALFFFRQFVLHVAEFEERPFVAYVFTLALFLMTSSLAHAFWPVSRHGRDLCFFLDYAALNFYAFGTATGCWAYFFSKRFYSTAFGSYYVPVCAGLCPLSTLTSCMSRFAHGHMVSYRVCFLDIDILIHTDYRCEFRTGPLSCFASTNS
jgi:predicted membrane channel-forming protein YqfA (hemolysin III family)